jgi:hypothetical protein
VRNDVTYVAIILGLFALMFALVQVCDLIIGSDETAMEEQGSGGPEPLDTTGGVDDEAVAA